MKLGIEMDLYDMFEFMEGFIVFWIIFVIRNISFNFKSVWFYFVKYIGICNIFNFVMVENVKVFVFILWIWFLGGLVLFFKGLWGFMFYSFFVERIRVFLGRVVMILVYILDFEFWNVMLEVNMFKFKLLWEIMKKKDWWVRLCV